MVALVWTLTVAAAVLYVLTATRIYRVDAVLAAVEQDEMSAAVGGLPSQLSSLASLVGSPGGGSAEIAIATLTGRQFTETFVRERDLLPLLFPARWSPESKQWTGRAPTPSDAYQLLERKGVRQLLRDRRSGLITLRLEHQNRGLISEMALGMVARTNDILRNKASRDASASIQYLSEELKNQPLVEVRMSVHRLIEAQIKRRMLAHVRPDYALTVVDFAGTPDANDYVWPRPAMIVSTAVLLGLILGTMTVMAWSSLLHTD